MIRIGVIGCGQRMRSLVRELITFGDLSLDMVYDPQPHQVQRFIREVAQGTPPTCCERWQQVAESSSLDWVLIGSPNAFHAQQASHALRSGRQVFLEKPLAVTRQECLDLIQVQEETRRCIAAGFVLRWSPLYQEMYRLVRERDFGSVISFSACEHISYDHGSYMMRGWRRSRELAGSYVLEKCVHDLDLIHWMTGASVSEVAARGGRDLFAGSCKERIPLGGDPAWEEKGNLELSHPCTDEPGLVEDHISAVLTCSTGVSGTLEASAGSAVPLRRLALHCLTGWIEAELYSGTVRYRTCSMKEEQLLTWSSCDLHGGGDAPLAAGLHRSMHSREPGKREFLEGMQATLAGIALGEAMERAHWVPVPQVLEPEKS